MYPDADIPVLQMSLPTQDPDRLTLLFSVVQQAPKLAVAINVYNQLRQLAERS